VRKKTRQWPEKIMDFNFLGPQVLSSGALRIHSLSFEDMGMFRCNVSNEFGHDEKETFVYPLAVSRGPFAKSPKTMKSETQMHETKIFKYYFFQLWKQ
jgi:hypothetical protein